MSVEPLNKELTCKRCGHVWTYKGTNPFVTTCPYCKTSVGTGGPK